MADDPLCLFWDSCIFYAYLKDESDAYDVGSIQQYLDEAKRGSVRIYTSTLAMAEIVPSAIKRPDTGSFQRFLDDYHGSVILIEANPNIVHQAAVLKDLPYRKGTSEKRWLSTIDAIMFASCIYQRDIIGVPISEFHTFGKGKTVPLLSYQEWCEGFDATQRQTSKPIIELKRRPPIHPHPMMSLTQPASVSQTVAGANAEGRTIKNEAPQTEKGTHPATVDDRVPDSSLTPASGPTTAQETPSNKPPSTPTPVPIALPLAATANPSSPAKE